AQAALTFAHEHLTESDAVMQTRTLETTALQRGMCKIVLADARNAITQQAKQGILLPVKEGLWAGQGYTTKAMLTLEQENLALMHAGQGQGQPVVAAQRVDPWHDRRVYLPSKPRWWCRRSPQVTGLVRLRGKQERRKRR